MREMKTEQQFVEKRGQELCDAYQNVRRDNGLGDFDNKVHRLLKGSSKASLVRNNATAKR